MSSALPTTKPFTKTSDRCNTSHVKQVGIRVPWKQSCCLRRSGLQGRTVDTIWSTYYSNCQSTRTNWLIEPGKLNIMNPIPLNDLLQHEARRDPIAFSTFLRTHGPILPLTGFLGEQRGWLVMNYDDV